VPWGADGFVGSVLRDQRQRAVRLWTPSTLSKTAALTDPAILVAVVDRSALPDGFGPGEMPGGEAKRR